MQQLAFKKQRGFTLVEIMITVAIIGILYMVALPSYSSYIQQSRRADVQQLLLQQAAVLERQYTRVGGYPNSYAFPESQYYQLNYDTDASSGNSNGTEYSIEATPQGAQSSDKCGTLRLDQSGVKTAGATGCW